MKAAKSITATRSRCHRAMNQPIIAQPAHHTKFNPPPYSSQNVKKILVWCSDSDAHRFAQSLLIHKYNHDVDSTHASTTTNVRINVRMTAAGCRRRSLTVPIRIAAMAWRQYQPAERLCVYRSSRSPISAPAWGPDRSRCNKSRARAILRTQISSRILTKCASETI